MGPLRHAIVVAALAALLAACSSVTRLAYNNAAFVATWMVDDWFDLQDGQGDWVRGRFAQLLAWHRASELPACERLLQDTAARAATRVGADDARRIYREMRALYHRSLRQGIPDMADFLLQLHPEQVEHLERKFAEDNARTARKILKGAPRERRDAAAKRYLERIEDWTGALSATQREQVRSRVEAMQDIADEWMDDRRLRQAKMLDLIRSRPSREAMIAALTRILVDTDSWRRPEYVAKIRARDEGIFAMIAALDATLTAEQRAKVIKRLAGYAADVAYLMAAN